MREIENGFTIGSVASMILLFSFILEPSYEIIIILKSIITFLSTLIVLAYCANLTHSNNQPMYWLSDIDKRKYSLHQRHLVASAFWGICIIIIFQPFCTFSFPKWLWIIFDIISVLFFISCNLTFNDMENVWTNINIPNGTTYIKCNEFSGYIGPITEISIPNSVILIGKYAFLNCHKLKTIIIPNSIIVIEDFAFSGCSSLKEIFIPEGVTTIGAYAFSGCSSLTSITIPSSVTKIRDCAFKDCTSLTNVYFKSIVPPQNYNWIFANNATGRKIYVPLGAGNAYKTRLSMGDYAKYIEEKEF